MTTAPKITAAYLRVSTVKQRDEETIETQRFVLRQYAATHGITLDQVYEDDGVSGGIEIHQRPNGGRLYQDIAADRIGELYLFHGDRVGRDTIDTLLFHRHAAGHGVRIVGVADGTDTFREHSALTTEIKAVIAAEYRRDCTRRTKAGLRRRAAAGFVNTRAPYGFAKSEGKLVIEDERAKVVKKVFNWYSSGVGTSEIVRRLEAMSAPAPRGNKWRHDTLIYMLRQRAYIGEFVHFRTKKKHQSPPRDMLTMECPAIIERGLFEAVQRKLEDNRRLGPESGRRAYLLRGLMRCGKCGLTYGGHAIVGRRYKDKRYPDAIYYECCSLSNQDYKFCGSVRIPAQKIEALVWSEIEGFLANPRDLIDRRIAPRYQQMQRERESDTPRQLMRIGKALEQNTQARKRIITALGNGTLTEEDVAAELVSLAQVKSELERERAAVEREQVDTKQTAKSLTSACALLETLARAVARGFDHRKRRAIVEQLVDGATVDTIVDENGRKRPQIKVRYTFTPPFCFGSVGSGFKASSRKK